MPNPQLELINDFSTTAHPNPVFCHQRVSGETGFSRQRHDWFSLHGAAIAAAGNRRAALALQSHPGRQPRMAALTPAGGQSWQPLLRLVGATQRWAAQGCRRICGNAGRLAVRKRPPPPRRPLAAGGAVALGSLFAGERGGNAPRRILARSLDAGPGAIRIRSRPRAPAQRPSRFGQDYRAMARSRRRGRLSSASSISLTRRISPRWPAVTSIASVHPRNTFTCLPTPRCLWSCWDLPQRRRRPPKKAGSAFYTMWRRVRTHAGPLGRRSHPALYDRSCTRTW